MNNFMFNKAFTLIELLIVVAIIGILTAIAVPNFNNAQIRAKVTHSLAEMRTLNTAINMLQSDKSVYLIDCVDSTVYTKQSRQRIEKFFGGVGLDMSVPRPAVDMFAPLTSPVSYLNELPQDPLTPMNWEGFPEWRVTTIYYYFDNDPEYPGIDHWDLWWPYLISDGEYILMGFGPAKVETYTHNKVMIPYDVSNGVVSMGDIFKPSYGEKIKVNSVP